MSSDRQLRYVLEWTDTPGRTVTDATWGRLAFFVGHERFWGGRNVSGPTGIQWTWVDLLEHLSEVWSWLQLEEGWPPGLEPLTPADFESSVRERLANQPAHRRTKEEQAYFEFRYRHDLSRALQGATVPPLWLVRAGHQIWLASHGRTVELPAAEVLAVLSRLGDEIADRVRRVGDERAHQVCADWDARAELAPEEKLSIATGLPLDDLRSLGVTETWLDESSDSFETTELMAAARMASPYVPSDLLAAVSDRIRAVPRRKTAELDDLSRTVGASSRAFDASLSPAEQGYSLAAWLRNEVLGVAAHASIDAEALLARWNVAVERITLSTPVLDAIAVWGPRHGPAVLVNSTGKHAQSPPGRAATLSHEIAHLLVDRDGALPFADVMGGHVPRPLEQRARAFAAELLAPKEEVGAAFLAGNEPEQVLRDLCNRYGASQELIAWQARNSDARLPSATLDFLRSKVSTPGHF